MSKQLVKVTDLSDADKVTIERIIGWMKIQKFSTLSTNAKLPDYGDVCILVNGTVYKGHVIYE